jgi:hypothetical protein
MASPAQVARLKREFPDALLFTYPKSGHSLERDFKWLGSHRYGILHLSGRDTAHLHARCDAASLLLGWPAPLRDDAQRPPVRLREPDPVALASGLQWERSPVES